MQRARRASDPDETREPALAERATPDHALLELSDVPAAVVCAACGQPDCPGCLALDEPTHASGVVAIVPWERPGLSVLSRLWSTARLATLSPREFFSGLPDGDLRAPLTFGILAEALAVAGLAPLFVGFGLLAPDMVKVALRDPAVQGFLVRAATLAGPSLVVLMVVLHVLHGAAIDRAARRAGSKKRGRGVRFGLYACGWDLVTLPLGLLLVALGDGPTAAARAFGAALTTPALATRAYLGGFHGLDPVRARAASRHAARLTATLGALSLIALAVIVVLASR
ncbi:MAG TPA: hypothetical protein VFZ53_21475 [Polyangiaceae bacterium]